jgi:hypothetical protein
MHAYCARAASDAPDAASPRCRMSCMSHGMADETEVQGRRRREQLATQPYATYQKVKRGAARRGEQGGRGSYGGTFVQATS